MMHVFLLSSLRKICRKRRDSYIIHGDLVKKVEKKFPGTNTSVVTRQLCKAFPQMDLGPRRRIREAGDRRVHFGLTFS